MTGIVSVAAGGNRLIMVCPQKMRNPVVMLAEADSIAARAFNVGGLITDTTLATAGTADWALECPWTSVQNADAVKNDANGTMN